MLHLFHWPVPDALPAELQAVCTELRAAKTQEECLRRAYDIVSRRFRASRAHTYILLHKILRKNVDRLWKQRGFLHCTHLNQFVKILLVYSGWFAPGDIRARWTLVSGVSPHQYLRVRMKDGRHMDVDVWGRTYGVPLGKHARGFNTTVFPVWKEGGKN